jgi:hypothetical protein
VLRQHVHIRCSVNMWIAGAPSTCGYHVLRQHVDIMCSVNMWISCTPSTCGYHVLCQHVDIMCSVNMWISCTPSTCGYHVLRQHVDIMYSVNMWILNISGQSKYFHTNILSKGAINTKGTCSKSISLCTLQSEEETSLCSL